MILNPRETLWKACGKCVKILYTARCSGYSDPQSGGAHFSDQLMLRKFFGGDLSAELILLYS